MHNSVKLLCAFPDWDAPLFASSWASTADHNRVFKLNAPNLRKVQKSMVKTEDVRTNVSRS